MDYEFLFLFGFGAIQGIACFRAIKAMAAKHEAEIAHLEEKILSLDSTFRFMSNRISHVESRIPKSPAPLDPEAS